MSEPTREIAFWIQDEYEGPAHWNIYTVPESAWSDDLTEMDAEDLDPNPPRVIPDTPSVEF